MFVSLAICDFIHPLLQQWILQHELKSDLSGAFHINPVAITTKDQVAITLQILPKAMEIAAAHAQQSTRRSVGIVNAR